MIIQLYSIIFLYDIPKCIEIDDIPRGHSTPDTTPRFSKRSTSSVAVDGAETQGTTKMLIKYSCKSPTEITEILISGFITIQHVCDC